MVNEQRVGITLIREAIEQHSTLIAQRERLLEALRGHVTDKCNCYGEVQCQNCETKALLEAFTTIEQERRTQR